MQSEISSKNQTIEPYTLKVLITADGSPTLLNNTLNESYHSRHGAKQESMHVFIQAGLMQLHNDFINVLEIGFGTGLNATLTALHKETRTIHYTALEPFPVALELLEKLKYFSASGDISIHQEIIQADFDTVTSIGSQFHLKKLKTKIQDLDTEEKYNLVYFDAFAPMIQPEMWTQEIFEQLFSMMDVKGVLVTYCAKGEVRRNMIAAGFSVERIAGPPGKREMLRAKKL